MYLFHFFAILIMKRHLYNLYLRLIDMKIYFAFIDMKSILLLSSQVYLKRA